MKFKTIKKDENQNNIQFKLTSKIWPEFMHHDIIVNKYWKYLFSVFPDFQISFVSNEVAIGILNSIPLKWNNEFIDLPDEGFDWALGKAVDDYNNKERHNLLIGLQISIDPNFQGQGLSALLLKNMKEIALENNIKNIAIPIRPTFKSAFPLIPMKDYITWKREDDLPFDPWLRMHIRNGCEIIKVCNKSMQIEGTIQEWENWTSNKYPGDGNYIVNGALTPISINKKENIGKYIEPNVWILYRL